MNGSYTSQSGISQSNAYKYAWFTHSVLGRISWAHRTCHVMLAAAIMMSLSVLSGCAGQVKSSSSSAQRVMPVKNYQAATEQSQTMYHYMLGYLSGVHSLKAEQENAKPEAREYSDLAADHLFIASQRLQSGELTEYAARAAMYAQNNSKAKRINQQWVAFEPNNPKAHEFSAILALKQNNKEDALAALSQTIELAPKTQQGLSSAARICSIKEYQPQGEQVMKTLASAYQDEPYSHFAYSQVLYQTDKKQAALNQIELMLRKKPKHKQSRVLRASIASELKQNQRALNELQSLVKDYPESNMIRDMYANVLWDEQQLTRAYQQLKILQKTQNKSPKIPFRMMMISHELGMYQQTERHVDEFLMAGGNAQAAIFYKAMLEQSRLNFAAAHDVFSQINDPAWLMDARFRQAKLQGQMHGYLAGIDAVGQLQSKHMDDKEAARIALARMDVYYDAGEYQKGLDEANAVMAKYPDNADVRYMRTIFLEQTGDVQGALDELESILKQNPSDPDIQNALGYSLLNQNDLNQGQLGKSKLARAQRLIEMAYAKRPDSAAVIDSMGWLRFKQKRYTQAAQFLKRAHGMQNNPEIAAHYAELLIKQGKRKQAAAVLKPLMKVFSNNKYMTRLIQRHQLTVH